MKPVSERSAAGLWKRGIPVPYGNIIMMMLPLDKLIADFGYQRPEVRSSVNRVRKNLKTKGLGIIQVAQYNNKYFVVDGKNRVIGLQQRHVDGLSAPTEVLCMIHLDVDHNQASELFEVYNANVPVQGNAKFHARLNRREMHEATINKLVTAEKFRLDFFAGKGSKNDNGITSTTWLARLSSKELEYLRPALQLLRKVWGNGKVKSIPPECRHGEIIAALVMFLKYQECKDVDQIAKQFRKLRVDIVGIRKATLCGYARPKKIAGILAA